MTLYQQKAIKTGRMGHQDTKLTSMRPRLKELNDIPYLKEAGSFNCSMQQYLKADLPIAITESGISMFFN